jgi:hypothetical protein
MIDFLKYFIPLLGYITLGLVIMLIWIGIIIYIIKLLMMFYKKIVNMKNIIYILSILFFTACNTKVESPNKIVGTHTYISDSETKIVYIREHNTDSVIIIPNKKDTTPRIYRYNNGNCPADYNRFFLVSYRFGENGYGHTSMSSTGNAFFNYRIFKMSIKVEEPVVITNIYEFRSKQDMEDFFSTNITTCVPIKKKKKLVHKDKRIKYNETFIRFEPNISSSINLDSSIEINPNNINYSSFELPLDSNRFYISRDSFITLPYYKTTILPDTSINYILF